VGKTSLYSQRKRTWLTVAGFATGIAAVVFSVPVIAGTSKVKAQGEFRHTDVVGINHMAAAAWQLNLASGSFLPEDDINRPRQLAVLLLLAVLLAMLW